MSERISNDGHGAGARFGGQLFELCLEGIRLRASGRCLAWIDNEGTLRDDEQVEVRRHLSRGHDPECRAFGLPRGLLDRFVLVRDTSGAWALIDEAFSEALQETLELQAQWNEQKAREALEFAYSKRLSLAIDSRMLDA